MRDRLVAEGGGIKGFGRALNYVTRPDIEQAGGRDRDRSFGAGEGRFAGRVDRLSLPRGSSSSLIQEAPGSRLQAPVH